MVAAPEVCRLGPRTVACRHRRLNAGHPALGASPLAFPITQRDAVTARPAAHTGDGDVPGRRGTGWAHELRGLERPGEPDHRMGGPAAAQAWRTGVPLRGGEEVKTVGTLLQGVPVPALPWTKWSDVGPLLVGVVGVTLVSLTDTIATATSFAARRGDEVDPDQEMVGIGTSNIAAGFFQGFAVSVSGSRTAVADQSGARTQLTGLAGAGLVAVLLLFLNGLLADLPQTALAAAVITAALSLIDLGAPPAIRPGPHLSAHSEPRRCRWRDSPGRAPGDHRGNRPRHPVVLSPELLASTPHWTESTSIPASTRPSMRSAMRPRTALCRPMKGCRLHEHRP